MTQQIINYGAAPNDGTGDPLRTAFIKTDDNFDQIWAAGPVGSNITIINNTVGVTNTNGNLILSPNGIGVVQVNNHVVPRANRVYDLGSSSLQYRAVYANAVNATALSVSGDQTVSGDLTVAGNLIVEGDTIQIGNITTDTKTIQLSNSASNAAAANLSGVTVGSNDNIATLLYNSTGNTWNTNIGITATGNITAPYLFGNAAFLTGLPVPYGNTDVAAFLAAYGSNTVVTTGNITAGNVAVSSAGNTWIIEGAYIRGPGGAYWHSHPTENVDEFVSAPGEFITIKSIDNSNVTQAALELGNTYTEIFVENGTNRRWRFEESGTLETAGDIVPVTAGGAPASLGTVSNPWASLHVSDTSYLSDVSITGNIVPSANAAYSLGNVTNQWANLWVANNTIYLGGVPLGIGAGNVLTVGGEPLLSNDSNTSITTTGNITSSVIAATTYVGNVGDFTNNAGYITLANLSVTTASPSGNGSLAYDNTSGVFTYTPADANLSQYGDSNVATFLAAFGSNNIVTTGNVTAANFLGNINAAGVVGTVGSATTAATVTTAAQPNITSVGTLTSVSVTGNITTGNILTNGYYYANGAPFVSSNYGDSNVVTLLSAFGSNSISTTGNITAGNISGNISITGNVTGTSANVTLVAGSYSWSFNNTGNLVLPGNAFTVNYANGTAVQLGGAGTYGNANVADFLDSLGSNAIVTTGNVSAGNLIALGVTTTGVNSILAGPTFVPLSNTAAGFVANVNSYSQITFQNKNSGADATADYILTADNGSDTVNYGDFGIINSGYDINTPTNSLGNIVRAGDTYIYAQGNVSNTSQSGGNLVLGTSTSSKYVKIFAGGNTASALVANISNTGIAVTGNVTATNFIGNVSLTGNIQGTSANVELVAGSYTWTFDNTGIVSLPAVGGDEGGEINFAIPTANTTLVDRVKFDVYQDRIRFFDGSTKGAYIDMSQAGTGVGTLLNNRVSGYVDAGTYVTMDNLKATVSTAGNRSLQIATVSGSFSAYINGLYSLYTGGTSGSGVTVTITTTPALAINWNFTSAGDLATYIISDTTNSRCYRVTMLIGASYLNNMIGIERLI